MSQQVWKFPIDAVDHPVVKMPRGAKVIDFRTQGGEPFVWAIVDPDAEPVDRVFRLAGTGHDLGAHGEYVGSVHLAFSGLVFHLFDEEMCF